MSQSGCVGWVLNVCTWVCRVCCRWALQFTVPQNPSLVMTENLLCSCWTWAVKTWLDRSQMSANLGSLNTILCLLYFLDLDLYVSWSRVLPGLLRESNGVLSAGQVNAELTWVCLSFRVRTSYFQFLSTFLLPSSILEKSSTVRVWLM